MKLKSGFEFNYGNMYGEGKVTDTDIASLADKITAAAAAVDQMRVTGEVRGHLSKDGNPEKVLFSQLPYIAAGNLNSPDSIAKLKEFGATVRNNADVVVSLGIGGSYLGNKVLFDVNCGEFWNQLPDKRDGWPEIYFSGNNIDPRRTTELIDCLKRKAEIIRTHQQRSMKILLLLISKSGSTLDTMSNFLVMQEALQNEAAIELEVVAVTDPDEENPTLLKRLAMQNGWRTFAVPDGIGGRFSVFSEVGLSLAVCFGFDVDGFLAGARAMDEACRGDKVEDNPALMNAVLKYLAGEKYGRDIEVLMPYGDYLKSLAEWYIQLLAESLGKTKARSGQDVYYGRTPIVAVGTTDMHAQTQQHQEGKLNKVVQFVRVVDWEADRVIPDLYPEEEKLSAMAGVTMAEALDVARLSNERALAGNGRFSALFSLPELNAFHLGELMYLLALSVAYEGELADVDAFDQPGVEAYKRIMGPELAARKKKK